MTDTSLGSFLSQVFTNLNKHCFTGKFSWSGSGCAVTACSTLEDCLPVLSLTGFVSLMCFAS